MVKNLPANAGDRGSVPGLGRCHMSHVPSYQRLSTRACAAQGAPSHRSGGEAPGHRTKQRGPRAAGTNYIFYNNSGFRIRIPGLFLTSCTTVGQLHNLSVPQFTSL